METETTDLRVFDLFSGIGGFSYGLEKIGGFKTTTFCEIEDYCCRVLKKHWPDVPIVHDATKIKGTGEGYYDVITGGFPCQNISIGGKGDGITGEKSKLWKEYWRLINDLKPKYAIIENVHQLLGRGLNIVLQDLAEIGYDATWTTIDTQYVGLPQRRRRVYILAVRDGIPEGADIFDFEGRDSKQLREKMGAVKKSFGWDFTTSEGKPEEFAYYTRQRSDEFACCGVSSALLKRDYKDFKDVITQQGIIRKITPSERMLLQGYPSDWMDDCNLTTTQQFTCNGMSIPVVEYIGRKVLEYDRAS